MDVPDMKGLPRTDRVLAHPALAEARARLGPSAALALVRAALEAAREKLRGGGALATEDEVAEEARARAARWLGRRTRRVINATGVVLHTNLGRAPLSDAALSALAREGGGYVSLEVDLETGKRGGRAGFAEYALVALTGAEAALVVNNNAAAVLLALAAFAKGRPVLVSRGELVEIGGGFRVPEVLERSGARLVEVGTTNRTRVADYEQALEAHPDAAAILRVHPGNFRQLGFVERPSLPDLVKVGRERGLAVIEDLGGGAILPIPGLSGDPLVGESVAAGPDLVTFSTDKILGGPQGGVLVGKRIAVELARKDPLARALRLGRLPLVALEATLESYLAGDVGEVPAMAMARRPLAELRARAARWTAALEDAGANARLVDLASVTGGGTYPGESVPSVGLALDVADPDAFLAALRRAESPVLARIEEGAVVCDARTVLPGEEEALVRALRTVLRLAVVLAVLLVAPRARAYTVETPVTGGCHELITAAALRDARAVSPAAAPVALMTDDDQAMASDLPFSPAVDMRDLGGITILLGVRDNDLKGLLPTDLTGLAIVQGDPTMQGEHCLRSFADVEPTGTPDALAACKTYILGRIGEALVYLTPDGAPDPSARIDLTVGLAIRGSVPIPLPGFYVFMGEALHALEDGFSHSYRAPDAGAVTASLTWLHVLDNDLDEAVDGPPHTAMLDECASLDALRTVRLKRAEDASKLLLLAALGPGGKDLRLANAGAVLDEYLAYQPGCTAANGWCNAPEHAYSIELDGCSIHAGRRGGNGVGAAAVLVALGLVARRRRRRTAACVGALLATNAARAFAADATSAPTPCPPPPVERAEPTPRLGAYAAVGGALNNTAINVSLAGRLWLAQGWLIGVDVEYNPWFSIVADGAKPGALNAYMTLVHRWPPWTGAFGLRSTLHLGTSTILFDLFGVPRFSTGIYLGANLLGAEWKVGRNVSFVVDPADVAFPVPQLSGTPFGYLQYRITVGLQWGA